jgi:hypothetical protein
MVYPDTSAKDAFGNLRISTPHTLFNNKQIADGNPLAFDELITGAGATSVYQANNASSLLTVPANVESSVIRQSKRWMNYQSGKSQRLLLTAVLGGAAAGITRRVGLLEEKNGLFFQLQGSTLSIGKRSFATGAAVDVVVSQANWNVDRLDGTGPSGVTIDPTKMQIFIIDYQWLGAGRVRYGISIAGEVIYCHYTNHANGSETPYISTPNLPVRYEIRNDGTGAEASLLSICSCVESEAGSEELGFTRTITRGATPLTTLNDASLYPLIAVRLKSTHLSSVIRFIKYSIACSSNALFEYQLILNPTVVGTALSFTPLTNGSVEYDVSRTNVTTVSGGEAILDSAIDTGGAIYEVPHNIFWPGTKIDGTTDIIVLAVRRLTGAAETFFASLVLSEAI